MHIAEPLLQPHNEFAIGGEAKVSRLDDAGVHGPDRNLVQPLAFRRQEDVRRRRLRALLLAERMVHVPETEIEPGPRIGRADRFQPEQAADRAFEPQRRRMLGGDARILAVLAGVTDDGNVTGLFIQQRHVHVGRIAPQAEQRAVTARQQIDRLLPAVIGDKHARPRPVCLGGRAMFDAVNDSHGAIPAVWRRFRSR